MKHPPPIKFESTDLNGLLPLLQWMDMHLEQMLSSTDTSEERANRSPVDVSKHEDIKARSKQANLNQETETYLDSASQTQDLDQLTLRSGSPVEWLQQSFQLSWFELVVLTIAIAPELDRRYEKLYAYLQEDARCVRPSVDLALNLLCATSLERLEQRHIFSSSGSLIHHQLLHLVGGDGGTSTLLNQEIHLNESTVQLLLGQSGLARSLSRYCRWDQPSPESEVMVEEGLKRVVLSAWEEQRPLCLYIQSSDRTRTEALIRALASLLQVPVISADVHALVREKVALSAFLGTMVRSAWFQNALLYLDGLDGIQEPEHLHLYPQVWEAIAEHPGMTVLSGSQPYRVIPHNRVGVVTVPLPELTVNQRRFCWQQQLQAVGLELDGQALDQLSDRYQLTPTQIANGVDTACKLAQWQDRAPTLKDFLAAARGQSGHDLATHAQKVEAPYGWDDLVLPADTTTQLKQLCNQARYRYLVQDIWGFGQKLALGAGLTALFVGLPGTGKTMAASVIAKDLDLDLYKIDLSQVVSKYIGETEKSLSRIFDAATHANAVLLFDEADALFGKRTEVRDAHDRYANIETSYLLQKMEEYTGIAILTSNLQSNMDDAFVRRLRFIVDFPMPGMDERRHIWRQIWPDALPRSPDIDIEFLAQQLEIAGAVIRNIALRAAYLAADDGGSVEMVHIIQAVRWEYQKMGKVLMKDDLKQFGTLY